MNWQSFIPFKPCSYWREYLCKIVANANFDMKLSLGNFSTCHTVPVSSSLEDVIVNTMANLLVKINSLSTMCDFSKCWGMISCTFYLETEYTWPGSCAPYWSIKTYTQFNKLRNILPSPLTPFSHWFCFLDNEKCMRKEYAVVKNHFSFQKKTSRKIDF